MSTAAPTARPRRLIAAVPHSITLAGAFCGMLSISWAPHHPYWAANAIIIASVCDMVDGRVARMTGTTSALGAQLDSLADIISFGLAPAFLIYQWGLSDLGSPEKGFDAWLLVAFSFVACAALRLARFNVGADVDEGCDEFEGIPSPVAALFVTGLMMTWYELEFDALRGVGATIPAILLAAGLMVSKVPFPSYKHFRNNLTKFAFYGSVLGGCLTLLFGGPGGSILFGVMSIYILQGLWRAWRTDRWDIDE